MRLWRHKELSFLDVGVVFLGIHFALEENSVLYITIWDLPILVGSKYSNRFKKIDIEYSLMKLWIQKSYLFLFFFLVHHKGIYFIFYLPIRMTRKSVFNRFYRNNHTSYHSYMELSIFVVVFVNISTLASDVSLVLEIYRF